MITMDNVRKSQYGECIQHLLDNPELARTELGRVFCKPVYPNCWGTAVYVVGGNERVRELWSARHSDLDTQIDASGNYVRIFDTNIPGYVGDNPMGLFLSTCTQTRRAQDRIVSFYWGERNLWGIGHAGIIMEDGMFHKPDQEKPFEIVLFNDYLASLSDTTRETLEVKFHSVPELVTGGTQSVSSARTKNL